MEKQLNVSTGSNGSRPADSGLLPTPPLPDDLPAVQLTDNARQVLVRRYVRRGPDGQPAETVEEMFWRVAYHIAAVEEKWAGDAIERARAFYELLTSKRFFPNSPTFTGAGTPLGQLAACFTADMRVTTDLGVKKIADIQVGDRVLTHEGRYRAVTETFQRAYEGELLRIKIKLIKTELEVTPEHPILTPRGWVQAKSLKAGDKVAIGMPVGERPVPQFDLADYVTENASDTAQISLPPLQSRRLVKQAFGVQLPEPDGRYLRNTVTRQEGAVYFEIETISSESYSGTVYNCEVDEDHSYVAEGVVVHNCFVLPISDDMGRDAAGIFTTLRNAALIQQTGGGNGFSFSRLRPKGGLVKSSAGQATGPVGFLRVYDHAFGEIAQGGCLLPETLVFTTQGLLRLDEIADTLSPGWQPHSLSVATDQGTRTSPRAYNNGVAPVLRVHTSNGLSLAGTYEHKVKVMTDAGPEWRALKDLRKGDWMMVKLNQHAGRLQALRRPVRHHGNQALPILPSLLDEELAFFLGYLAGDGFVTSRTEDHRIGVSVAHTSYLMQEMPALMRRLFGVTVHAMQKADDASITLTIDNRAVKEFLCINGLDKPSSREARIPRLVRQSPPQVVGAYLRGLFEADGSLSHGYPHLTTTSPRLAEEAATLLIGLGCPVRIWSMAPGVSHYGKATIYHVRIGSSAGLQAWRERIGCDLRSRFVAAYAWQADAGRESVYRLPNPRYWLLPVLAEITLPQVDERAIGRNFRSLTPPLRKSLLRYLRGDRHLTRSAYEAFRQEHPAFAASAPAIDDRWFVQVTGIEPAGESLTLDLEVDDNHTYLANGMVTHNTRRGANMGVLRVDHPDVEEFITCKTDENAITNFNISVGITDAFMQAVEEDADWDLRFPDISDPRYRAFRGTLEQAEAAGIPLRVYKTVRARELFDKIVRQAHHNGEPGVLFLDAANRDNPVPHLYPLESTNPCGEQWLGPFENCCLGSVNLAKHLAPDGQVDWEKLRESVVLSTIFLDDVVEANAYVPAVPQLAEAAHRARRIGLGIMGLADLMYHAGIRYGSPEGQEFAAQVMEFVRYESMRTSVALAEQRRPFPAITGSIYDPEDFRWQPPESIVPYENDWGRPEVDWDSIVADIRRVGIRNAAQTTIAPTGTIATVAGCEGYGCEPVFALAYIRHVNDNGKDLKLTYASPAIEKTLEELHVTPEQRQAILDQIMREGSCQAVEDLPEAVRSVFVTSADITAEEHVRMQAALQAFVDNSLSKTVNFPAGATEQDVATAYQLAWKLGAKGITVYVTGSRDKVVLETHATAEKKQIPAASAAPDPAEKDAVLVQTAIAQDEARQLHIWHESKKPRPRVLPGFTYNVNTPLGKTFVTVNENGGTQPFEVFITCAKAGSDTAAVSDAIGRLISYVLRLASPVAPVERLQEVIRQLSGIGGGRPLGFGPNRVRSLPDGVAQVLTDYMEGRAERQAAEKAGVNGTGTAVEAEVKAPAQPPLFKIGDLCPECGQAAVVNEEGCRKCYACGFSEC